MTHQGRAAGETRAELADRFRDQIQQLPWDTTEEDTVLRGQWLRTNGDDILAALRVPAAPAATLDVWDVATALHDTAPLGHNLGEGSQRAICNSIEAHADRAERIVAALAPSAGSAEGAAEVERLRRLICTFAAEWGNTQRGADADARFNSAAYDLFEAVDCSESRPAPGSTGAAQQPSHPAAPSIGEAQG